MKSIYKENIFELYWINMNYVNLGIKFKTARIKLDYNQEYVAEMMGVGQRYISKIEHGLARPEFATICKLANLLGVSLKYLSESDSSEKKWRLYK